MNMVIAEETDRATGGFTVSKEAEANLPTEFGSFKIIGFRSTTSDEEFVALIKGEINPEKPTLARIHSQCLTGDVFHSLKCDCGPQLERAMEMIQAEGAGGQAGRGRPRATQHGPHQHPRPPPCPTSDRGSERVPGPSAPHHHAVRH